MELEIKLKIFNDTLKKIFIKHLGDDIKFETSIGQKVKFPFDKYEHSSSINISGSLKGRLYFLLPKEMLKFILIKVYQSEYSQIEEEGLLQDSLNEFLNLIVANSTELLSVDEIPVKISVPYKFEQKSIGTVNPCVCSNLNIFIKEKECCLIFISDNKAA